MAGTAGLQVDPELQRFVEGELLPGLDSDLTPEAFWAALADLQGRFAPRIAELLARRDEIQARIDAWHEAHGPGEAAAYEKLLTELGYLLPADEPASISVEGVDDEIAEVPGPQ